MAPFRIVHSNTFTEDLERIGGDEFLKSEAYRAVSDALTRNPLVGKVVGESSVRLIFANPTRAMPIAIYYVYENGGGQVTLIGLRRVGM